MSEWTDDELTQVGRAEEVQIASVRSDGSLRNPVTIWAVRHGNDLYIRSVRGRDSAWFHGVQETHAGQISAGRLKKEVAFVEAGPDMDGVIDTAYRSKYRRYAGRILNSVLTPKARSTTLRVVPRQSP